MSKKRYIPEQAVRGICHLCQNNNNMRKCEDCCRCPLGDGSEDHWQYIFEHEVIEIERRKDE